MVRDPWLPLLALALALTACGDPEEEVLPPDPETLFTPGPEPVGYLEARLAFAVPGQEAEREIPVHVWYPADPSGEAAATYAAAGVVSIPSSVALAAPAPAAGGPHPVVVYSHGSGGEGQLGYAFGEHLASHGYVVLAPDHVGNTASDFINGSLAPFVRVALDRPLDVSATLDGAPDLVAGLSLDASQALVVGHSFGGYTTLAVGGAALDVDGQVAACAAVGEGEDDGSCALLADPSVEAAFREGFRDDRVLALVPQAPALVSIQPDSLAELGIPTLLQSGRQDATTPHETQAVPTWEGLAHPDDVWVDFPEGAHYTFITICDDLTEATIRLFRPDAFEDGCGEDFVPTTEAMPAVTAYLHAWAEIHLRGEVAWQPVVAGEGWRPFVDITARE